MLRQCSADMRLTETMCAAKSFLGRGSRQDREGSCRKPEPIAHFRPGHDNQCALWRYLVEVGHYLDLIVPMREDVGLGFHFIGRVGIEGFVSRRGHATMLVQKFDRIE